METHNAQTTDSHLLHIRLGLITAESSSLSSAVVVVRKQPEILSILATVLERSIHTSEKVLKRSRTIKDKVTVFHGTRAPALSIRQYIQRVFDYSRCSPSCLVVAYVYLDSFVQQTASYLTSLNVHRLLLTCLLLAVKFLEDEHYNNSYFAKIGGISRTEMNELEKKLLSTLNYRLQVSGDMFNQYCTHLEKESTTSSSSSQPKWSIRNYGSLKPRWLLRDGPSHHGKTCALI